MEGRVSLSRISHHEVLSAAFCTKVADIFSLGYLKGQKNIDFCFFPWKTNSCSNFPPTLHNYKTEQNTMHWVTVFRHWTEAAWDEDPWEKKTNKGSPKIASPYCLENVLGHSTKRSNPKEHSGLTELRKQKWLEFVRHHLGKEKTTEREQDPLEDIANYSSVNKGEKNYLTLE